MLGLFLTFSHALVPDGYHTFHIKAEKPFSITLTTSMLVLAVHDRPANVQFVVIDPLNQTFTIPIDNLSHVIFADVTLVAFLKDPAGPSHTINFWLLPKNLCSSNSYSAVVDDRVSFSLRGSAVRSDFCVFLHSNAKRYSASLDFDSSVPGTLIEFDTNSDRADQSCERGSICEFSARSPFMVRVVNVTNAQFTAAVSFSADRETIDLYGCGVRPIPFFPNQAGTDGLVISDVQCISTAETTLRKTGIVMMLLVTFLVCVINAQRYGLIDLKTLIGRPREVERFLSLKEKPLVEATQGIDVEERAV
jgi:hypothetical protein